MLTARLACVRHAASVRSEPGSNSQVHPSITTAPQKAPQQHPNELPRLSTLTNYFSANPKQPSTKPQHPEHIPTKEHTPRRRPRIPPRHSSQQGKNTQKQSPAPSHPKTAKHYQLPKKPDAIVKQQKKNQQQNAPRHPTSPAPSTPPIIGRAKTLASNHQPVKPKKRQPTQ